MSMSEDSTSNSFNPVTRRSFLKTSTITLAAGGLISSSYGKQVKGSKLGGLLAANDVVLFQGDSITDAGRSRETASKPNLQAGLGSGYAWLAGAELLVDYPDANLSIYNRGISGNKVHQLAERWQVECLDIKPNVLSILIGVNDFWHALNGNYKGTVEIYEKDYRELLKRTSKALPKTKIIICEPFVLRCGAVNDKWFPEFDKYRAASKKLADEFKASFVPFQTIFDRALNYAPPAHWAGDGVHPSSSGASLMAHHWLQAAAGGR